MIVQIYEIQDPKEAEACIDSGVDHIGSVILSKEAWRLPPIKETIRVSREAGVKNSLLPLFRDEETIHRILDYYAPTYLHFCDNLTNHLAQPEDLESLIGLQGRLKEKFPEVGIIRTIPIPQKDGACPDFPFLEMARSFTRVTDIFLIDTWVEKAPVEGFVGITGQTADWDRAADMVLHVDIPVILAGGLSPENVHEAVVKVFPAGADSCTRTNEVDGSGNVVRFKKDFKKV